MHDLASRSIVVRLTVLVFVLGAYLAPGRAAAGGAEDARAYNEKATAAFALGRYAEAAVFFEKAFEMKTDPALLYNAAQAHRMAGNKERALALYQNYLRVYGGKGKRADVEAHIDELKKAIAHDQEVANAPPTNTEPIGGGTQPEPMAGSDQAATQPVAPLPSAAPAAPAAAVLVSQPPAANAQQNQSLTQKPWFWVAVGGGVAVAVTVILIVALGGSKNPSPSIGVVP